MAMRRIRELKEWASDNYMRICCWIVGVPLLGLIMMELACWIYLQEINSKIAVLESMF